jgi:hypothetical protein
MKRNMEIAPGIKVEEWLKLKLNSNDSPDWEKAIEIFRIRIEKRYFEPVKIIIQNDSTRNPIYGFTVLAIDCLLIETLQSFKEGWPDTYSKEKQKKVFFNFLTSTKSFKSHFDKEKAIIFQDHYRNGILHQGEIKYNSIVTTSNKESLVSWNPTNKEMIINRKIFHDLLLKEFNNYIDQLKNGDLKLRKNFITKMNYICRVSDEVGK